jgi:hypothetical protein
MSDYAAEHRVPPYKIRARTYLAAKSSPNSARQSGTTTRSSGT